MLSKERMYTIMNILNKKLFVTIKELEKELGVSRSSVMRDLIELENQGLIVRERGGATAKNVTIQTLTSFNETPVASKELIHSEEKQKICEEAAKKIKDGESIYLDSGTTPAYLLPYIVDKRVKIVTSSTYLIRKLPDTFKGDIFLLGGEYKKGYDMLYGSLTLEMIRQFNFEHAFLSTNGVNLDNGEVYIFEFSIGAVKKEIMKRSLRNYLLIDSSKYDVRALYTWARTEEFNAVYVNDFPENMEIPDNYIICK